MNALNFVLGDYAYAGFAPVPVLPDLLVFDLDGTLIDTMGDYADHAAALIQTHFAMPFAEARRAYFATSGLPFEQQLRQLFPDATTDPVAAMFEDWKDSYLSTVALPAETEALFDHWRAQGFRIAISSNNLQTYVSRMAKDWPVDCALGYRPSPDWSKSWGKGEDHFRLLEQRFGLSRSHFLFTGDSPNDARIALRCGVDFRALLRAPFTPADFTAIDRGIVTIETLDKVMEPLALATT
jgi:phosphoglycolate phosphatase-like HAD superfamily hydrolase